MKEYRNISKLTEIFGVNIYKNNSNLCIGGVMVTQQSPKL